jgi:hypothetical protein
MIVEKLNAEIVKLLHDPTRKSTPDQFAAYIRSEIGRFAKIVKDSGAKVSENTPWRISFLLNRSTHGTRTDREAGPLPSRLRLPHQG